MHNSATNNYQLEIPQTFTAINKWYDFLLETKRTDDLLYKNIVKAYFSILSEQWYIWDSTLSTLEELTWNTYWRSNENAENLCLLIAFYMQKQWATWLDKWQIIKLLSPRTYKELAVLLSPIFLKIQETFKKNVGSFIKTKEIYSKELHNRLSLYTAVPQWLHKNIKKVYNHIDSGNFFWWVYNNPEEALLPLPLTESIILSDTAIFSHTDQISTYFIYYWLTPEYSKISKARVFTLIQRLKPYYDELEKLLQQTLKTNNTIEVNNDLFQKTLTGIKNYHDLFESDNTIQLVKWRNTTIQQNKIQSLLSKDITNNPQYIFTTNKYRNLLTKNPSEIAHIFIKEWFHKLACNFAEQIWELYNKYLINFIEDIMHVEFLESSELWIIDQNTHTYLCLKHLLRQTVQNFTDIHWSQYHRDFIINPTKNPCYNIITPISNKTSLQQWIEIRAYFDPLCWKISYYFSNRWLPKEISYLTITFEITTNEEMQQKVFVSCDRWTYFHFPKELIEWVNSWTPNSYSEAITHNYLLYTNLVLQEEEQKHKDKPLHERKSLLKPSDITYPYSSYELDEQKKSYSVWLAEEIILNSKKNIPHSILNAENKDSFLSHSQDEIFLFRSVLHQNKLLDTWVIFANEKWFISDTYHLWISWIQTNLPSYCKWTSKFFLGFNTDSVINIMWQHPNQWYMYRLCYELWIVQWARWKLQPVRPFNNKLVNFIDSLITNCNLLVPNLQEALKAYSLRSIQWWNPSYCHARDDQPISQEKFEQNS